jgi:DmsE family decaheme c-type cytochrome
VSGLIFANTAVAADAPPAQVKPAATVAQARTSSDAICTRCHDESETVPILAIYQTKHGVKADPRTPGCQSCHGASENHLKSKKSPPDVTFGEDKSEAKAQDGACLKCHKSDKRTHWEGGAHQVAEVSCSNCHKVHASNDKVRSRKTQTEVCFTCHQEQRADSEKVSTHPMESGKVICSDCHNPHGSAGPGLLKKNTVTETCFSCHAEKRGPFLWEHQPVTEDCSNCHSPHGSNISPLLKSRAPFLCDECHNGPHNSPVPYGPGAALGRPGAAFIPGTSGEGGATASAGYGDRSAAGRACMNCHNMVHGSNSPSGAFLHR